MKYEQVKKDYKYMVDNYGAPNDLAGGFVINEKVFELLENPTKAHAKKIYIELVKFGFQDCGYIWSCEGPSNSGDMIDISHDDEAIRIYNDYI